MAVAKTMDATDIGAAEWLASLPEPGGAGWAQATRASARDRLLATGLPRRRDEYWKYTDPRDLTAISTPEAAIYHGTGTVPFHGVDRLKIIFVDGVLNLDESDELALEGVEIDTLEQACAADIHWAKDLFGVLETAGQTPVSRPLAALNTATVTQGLAIRVLSKAARPISINYRRSDTKSDAMVHHVIRVEEGAELTFLENGPAAARFNCVTEVDVADRAVFHHVRTQGRAYERRAATHMFGRIGQESLFKSFTLTVNGALIRNDVVLDVLGDHAVAHVAGAAIGDGVFHHDDTVFITHASEHCESRQVFKNVLRNGARGVFQGKILVKEGAQKTDGYQLSQALLLDDDAQFLAKPELEIYADDVACSHGSTTGAIDETALFFLRSRGIPEREAQDLLVLAFLSESLDEIENPEIVEDLNSRLGEWLRHRKV